MLVHVGQRATVVHFYFDTHSHWVRSMSTKKENVTSHWSVPAAMYCIWPALCLWSKDSSVQSCGEQGVYRIKRQEDSERLVETKRKEKVESVHIQVEKGENAKCPSNPQQGSTLYLRCCSPLIHFSKMVLHFSFSSFVLSSFRLWSKSFELPHLCFLILYCSSTPIRYKLFQTLKK